jgi:hypothetical protein
VLLGNVRLGLVDRFRLFRRAPGCDQSNFAITPIETEGSGQGFVLIWTPAQGLAMAETRKLTAILVADTVDYSRHAGADEERRDFLSAVLLA